MCFFNLRYVLVHFGNFHINIRQPVSPVKVCTLQMHRVVAFLKKQMVARFQVNKIGT